MRAILGSQKILMALIFPLRAILISWNLIMALILPLIDYKYPREATCGNLRQYSWSLSLRRFGFLSRHGALPPTMYMTIISINGCQNLAMSSVSTLGSQRTSRRVLCGGLLLSSYPLSPKNLGHKSYVSCIYHVLIHGLYMGLKTF